MTDSEKLDYLVEEMTGVKKEIAGMKEEIAGMKEDIHSLQKRMDRQEDEIRKIRLFQENMIESCIKVIAKDTQI